MIKVYGIPNCNTVKKSLDWLSSNNIDFQFHNYKKLGISSEKIDEWFGQMPWEKFVNKAGTTFKQLPEEVKISIVNPKAAKELMLEKNSVIKRPIIESDTILAMGFDEKTYTEVFLK